MPGRRYMLIASLLGLAALGSACASPSSPLPTKPLPADAAPVRLTVSSVSPSSGPPSGGEVIRVSGTGFQDALSVLFDGLAGEVLYVRSGSQIGVRTPAHAGGPVDLVLKNPDGETTTFRAGYTYGLFSVTASPNLVAPGGDVTVTFSAPAGRDCGGGGDWIAVYPIGAPDNTGAANGHTNLWFDHVCAATSGTRTAKAPNDPGPYEVRYMTGDFAAARSSPFDVQR